MSKTLQNFYLAYAQWLDDGGIEQKPFSAWNGLCHNLTMFCLEYGLYSLANKYKSEMSQQFVNAGLSGNYPFDFSSIDYEEAGQRYECHLNPKRIAWVRNQVEKIKEL